MLQKINSIIGYATLICILVSGLLLNLLQLIVYILIRPISQNLFRKINSYLSYSCWSQSVAVTEWCSNVKFRFYYKDERAFQEFGKNSAIVIANHRYDVDWLGAWLLSDKLGTLGNDKAMLKSSLKYVPVFGWGWALNDMIFLSRNWNKDRESLSKAMDILLTYPRSLILAFYEGTRFTKQKYENSIKFAEERNISTRLKHHLLPRVRGFHMMIQRAHEGFKRDPNLKFDLYNLQIAIENDDNSKASLSTILGGQETTMHLYVERLDIKKVPANSEEEVTEYLYNVYKTKDEIFDYFLKNDRFPGIEKQHKRKLSTLMNWVVWMIVIYVTLFYHFTSVVYQGLTQGFTTGAIVYITLLVLTIFVFIRIVINSTKVSKSSSYGASDDKDTQRKKLI